MNEILATFRTQIRKIGTGESSSGQNFEGTYVVRTDKMPLILDNLRYTAYEAMKNIGYRPVWGDFSFEIYCLHLFKP